LDYRGVLTGILFIPKTGVLWASCCSGPGRLRKRRAGRASTQHAPARPCASCHRPRAGTGSRGLSPRSLTATA